MVNWPSTLWDRVTLLCYCVEVDINQLKKYWLSIRAVVTRRVSIFCPLKRVEPFSMKFLSLSS